MGAVVFLSSELRAASEKMKSCIKRKRVNAKENNIYLDSQLYITLARSGVIVLYSESVQLVVPRFDGQTLDWSETRYLSQSLLKTTPQKPQGLLEIA